MKLRSGVVHFHRATLKVSSRHAMALLVSVAGCASPVPAHSVHERPPVASSAAPRNDAPLAPSASLPALGAAAQRPAGQTGPSVPASSSAVADSAAPAGSSSDGSGESAQAAIGAQLATVAPLPKPRKPPTEVKHPTLWFCYVWAHLRFTTEVCLDTLKECRAQLPKEGITVRPCLARKRPVWCTEPYEVPEDPNKKRSQKCFVSEEVCDEYRVYVHDNGLASTPCVEVETK
jgi:hypothetical protein